MLTNNEILARAIVDFMVSEGEVSIPGFQFRDMGKVGLPVKEIKEEFRKRGWIDRAAGARGMCTEAWAAATTTTTT